MVSFVSHQYCFNGWKNYSNCLQQQIRVSFFPNVNYLLTSYFALICGCHFFPSPVSLSSPGFQEWAAAVGRAAGDKEETVAAPWPLPLPALQLRSKLPPSRLLPCLLLPIAPPPCPQLPSKDKRQTNNKKSQRMHFMASGLHLSASAQQTDSCSKLKACGAPNCGAFFASVRHQFSLILDSVANNCTNGLWNCACSCLCTTNWLSHVCSCCLLYLDWLECVLEWQ